MLNQNTKTLSYITLEDITHSKLGRKVINWLDVTYHKILVFCYMISACQALLKRAIVHDMTKYSKEESPLYEELFFELLNLKYGSEKYYKMVEKLKPAKEHHYKFNSHHPEHHGELGVKVMSPFDLIEMVCDWKAASKGHKNGSMKLSLQVGRERYEIPTELFGNLVDAVNEIGLLDDELPFPKED